MKQLTSSKKRSILLAAFALVLVIAMLFIGSGFSKYRTELVTANKVEYTNRLADSFLLLDVPVTIQEDGSYLVDESEEAQPTAGFTYKMIPGITVPAAPYVEITGKTEIPSFLYLEVEHTGSAELTFDGSWSPLGVLGKKGGDLYVYNEGEALIGEGDEEETLTFPTFTVNKLSKYPADLSEGEIKVYAYMIQKIDEQTAEQAYSSAPSV